jgi:hypothetical protein
LKTKLYRLMFDGVCPPTETIPVTIPCAPEELPMLTVVVTIVRVVYVDVVVCSDLAKYPAPTPANTATTNRKAVVQVLISQTVS